MNRKENIEFITRRVVELLHGKPYGEAIGWECEECGGDGWTYKALTDRYGFDEKIPCPNLPHKPFPITTGRLLQAIRNYKQENFHITLWEFIERNWQLVKEDGFTEADLTCQSDETLDELCKLFN